MKDIWAFLGYASSAPLVAVLTEWQKLFRGTWFARPGIDPGAFPTALLLGVLISFGIVVFSLHRGTVFLLRATIVAFTVGATFLFACGILRYALRRPWSPDTTWWLEFVWDFCYVAAMVDVFALVTVAALLIGASIRQSGTPA